MARQRQRSARFYHWTDRPPRSLCVYPASVAVPRLLIVYQPTPYLLAGGRRCPQLSSAEWPPEPPVVRRTEDPRTPPDLPRQGTKDHRTSGSWLIFNDDDNGDDDWGFIKGRNTASLAFKSPLAFSIGIHMTILARVSPAKREREMTCVFQWKKRDAIWTHVMLRFYL